MRPKLFFQALLGIVSTGAIIMILIVYFFGDNTKVVEKVVEKEVVVYRDAPAAVTPVERETVIQQPAAPVQETPVQEVAAPAAAETRSAVTSSGDIIELPHDTNMLQYFIDNEVNPAFQELFPNSFEATIVSNNEIMITIWDNGVGSDIDAIRTGDKNAVNAWRDFVDNFLSFNSQITWALRGYVPGADATMVVVDSRNHNDILLVTSDGFLFYDFDLDDGMDPFLIYNQSREK